MSKNIIHCDRVAKASGPYSSAVRIQETDLIFISGQVSEDNKGQIVGRGDIEAQTEQVLRNLQCVLESAGACLDDVVKVTVYLRNMEQRHAVAEVRQRFFRDNLPASTLVEVNKLAHEDWLIEMEAIAVIPHQTSQ